MSVAGGVAEVHPAALARLPPPAFGALASALLAAAGDAPPDAAAPALEGLAALCRYHLAEAATGRPGLGAAAPEFLGAVQSRLLNRLLSCRPDDAARDAVADALLPALLGAPAAWEALRQQLAGRAAAGGGAPDGERAAAALAALTAANGLTATLDRPNRRRFRANVAAFATDMQGLLRVQ